MRYPDALLSLTSQGIIDEVLRPLKSGKEAQVYLVRAGGETCVAKVYKDAQQRSFKQRAVYMEGRRVRNSRDRRAMAARSRHGKAQEESAWKTAEVDVLYRLHHGGVRVPAPIHFIDGVLLMELVRGPDGHPAPQLGKLHLGASEAREIYEKLLREVIKMLCVGIVHGDLSEYNILLDEHGPVIIDFPQSVDASQNRNAKNLLIRDVNNLALFLQSHVNGARRKPYGEEIWAAYEANLLTPDMPLTGKVKRSSGKVDVSSVLGAIKDAEHDEQIRQGLRPARERRKETSEHTPPRETDSEERAPSVRQRRRQVVMTSTPSEERSGGGRKSGGRRRGRSGGGGGGGGNSSSSPRRKNNDRPAQAPSRTRSQGERGTVASEVDSAAPKKRRRRRRRKAAPGSAPSAASPSTQRTTSPPKRGASKREAPKREASPSEQTRTDGDAAPRKRRRRRRRPRRDPSA